MGFGEAIRTCLRKYAVFHGRARRSEYWYYYLFSILAGMVAAILDQFVPGTGFRNNGPFSAVLNLALLLLSLAVTVRRLHDVDMSGRFVLIQFIPLIGWIIILVFACQRGTDGANRFGMGPASATIPEVFA